MEKHIDYDYGLVAPDGIRTLRDLETYLRSSGLEPALCWNW